MINFFYTAFLLIIIVFGLSLNVSAAPAPTLFAYNDNTKQCGTFRDGDEYVSYILPSDWRTYEYEISTSKSIQEYCKDLGYTNIGNVVEYLKLKPKAVRTLESNYLNKTKNFNYSLAIISIFIAISVVSLILIVALKQKNKKNG